EVGRRCNLSAGNRHGQHCPIHPHEREAARRPGCRLMSSDKRLAVLQNAPGPSPWYWKAFPTLRGHSGQRFVWTYHGNEGELAYLVTLGLEQEPSTARLALNTFCTPFAIRPDRLGIWCPEPGALRILCFDLDKLAGFS